MPAPATSCRARSSSSRVSSVSCSGSLQSLTTTRSRRCSSKSRATWRRSKPWSARCATTFRHPAASPPTSAAARSCSVSVARNAEHASDLLTRELVPAPGDRLVQEAHRVAHAPCRLARHQRQRRVVRLDLLLLEHEPQPLRDHARRDQLEVVSLAPVRMVTGNLVTSVVAKMNFTCGGGSSSVLRNAFHALDDSMWTSSTITTLKRSREGL